MMQIHPHQSQSTLARPRVLLIKCDFFPLGEKEITRSLARAFCFASPF